MADSVVDVGVGVVLREQEQGTRVLVTRRRAEGVLPGLWEIPGGKVEPGESIESCVRREIREEVGLDVAVGDEIGIWEHTYEHARVRLHAHWCRHLSGEARALEVADVAWVDRSALLDRQYPEASGELIERVASYLDEAR